jgi:hypothetical protein
MLPDVVWSNLNEFLNKGRLEEIMKMKGGKYRAEKYRQPRATSGSKKWASKR